MLFEEAFRWIVTLFGLFCAGMFIYFLGVGLFGATEEERAEAKNKKLGAKNEEMDAGLLQSRLGVKLLRNVLLPLKDGGTTEIDMVFVCRKGIFAVESKHRTGTVYGYMSSPWEAGGRKMENPIIQNDRHIRVLKEVLKDEGIPDEAFYNIVMINEIVKFSYYGKTEEISKYFRIKNIIITIADGSLWHGLEKMKKDMETLPDVIEKDKGMRLIEIIGRYQATPEQMQEHVEYVKSKRKQGNS